MRVNLELNRSVVSLKTKGRDSNFMKFFKNFQILEHSRKIIKIQKKIRKKLT